MTKKPLSKIVFIDYETTGLGPHHVPWEVAAKTGYIFKGEPEAPRQLHITHSINLDISLNQEHIVEADPYALNVGGYYRRRDENGKLWTGNSEVISTDEAMVDGRKVILQMLPSRVVEIMLPMIDGATMVASNPRFEHRLTKELFNDCGQNATHDHHHLFDIAQLMIGHILAMYWGQGPTEHKGKDILDLITPPFRANDLLDIMGIEWDETTKHTAAGDVDWTMRAFTAIYNLDIVEPSI